MSAAATKAREAIEIDVLVESDLWRDASGLQAVARRAVAAAAAFLSTPKAEVAIVLTDDSSIRVLNRVWRGVDKPTNVLSFPTTEVAGPLLGDILLAHETLAREAAAENKRLADHVAHLAVHGFLHLVGYDHESAAETATMQRIERDILCRLAIPDPYAHSRRA